MIVLFLAFSIPPYWVYLNAKTVQDRHTQRGIEMDNKVLDEAVAAAWMAITGRDALGPDFARDHECMTQGERDDMRSALLAGMKVLLGEPVAYLERETLNSADPKNYELCKAEWPGRYDDWFPVYAPSLGEGDGR